MGNEYSQMPGIVLGEKAVEVNDFWSHYSAVLSASNTTISVFIGEPLVGGSLWVNLTPLEKASKNLMVHRHPCILKYVSSWNKGSKFHLAVEDVKPLSHVLQTQSLLQIYIGLHSILKALVFLHETAKTSHNNVCTASIYVTKDGNWKLGGMEYLCKFSEISSEYMSKARSHRYNKAIDPSEDKYLQKLTKQNNNVEFIDIYAFSVLVTEVFKHEKTKKDAPLQEFLDLCKTSMQNVDITKRPKLMSLLQNGFFNHDFIKIHSFLVELPMKSDVEKDEFFTTLIERLGSFQQAIIAKQLGGLLLSRMLLLNKTAQLTIIPKLLAVQEEQSDALFDYATFREFIVPKLLEIFSVRDAQIRLLLLEHFNKIINCFTKEQLQNNILPELLLGIKDTNDHLVAVTLRSLADLIAILGSTIVIGGSRAKLFNDGMPTMHLSGARSDNHQANMTSSNMNLNISTNAESDILSNSSDTGTNLDLTTIERPSPDGEEVDTSTLTDENMEEVQNEPNASPINETWDDWDINEPESTDLIAMEVSQSISTNDSLNGAPSTNQLVASTLPDIFELDIKNMKNTSSNMDEFNFFQDMEPVINTSKKFLVNDDELNENRKLKEEDAAVFDFGVNMSTQQLEDGWGDDLNGWD